jgi:hypothetical protein
VVLWICVWNFGAAAVCSALRLCQDLNYRVYEMCQSDYRSRNYRFLYFVDRFGTHCD